MPIQSIAYDPSGAFVATGSADRTIKLWDIVKGFCTHCFREHTGVVQTLYFHVKNPAGAMYLSSSSDDNSVRVHNLLRKNEPCVATFTQHVSLPTQLCSTSDSSLLISAGRDKVVNFYSLKSLQHIRTVPVQEELESAVILSRVHTRSLLQQFESDVIDGTTSYVLLTAGEKGLIKFYRFQMKANNVASFKINLLMQLPLSQHCTRPIAALEYSGHSEDGDLWVVAVDHSIYSFNMSAVKKNLVEEIESKTSTDEHLSLTAQPDRLLVGNQGEILDMVCVPARLSTNKEDSEEEVQERVVRELVVVTNSPHVRVMDTDTLQCRYLEAHTDIVLSADVGPDGEWLVTSSKDRTCIVWHLPSQRAVAVCEGHTDAVGCVCTSQNPATYLSRGVFLVSGAGDKILKKWQLPTHSLLKSYRALQASSSPGLVRLTSQYSIRAHDKDINCVVSSPNDAMLASCSQDRTIRLWNVSDLTPIATLNGHKRGVWRVQFSPIDKVLASCSGDRTVRLWSLSDWSCLRTLEGNSASVLCVSFVNKGSQLMSGSADGLLRLWTVRTGECEATFDRHVDKVWVVRTLDRHNFNQNGDPSSEQLPQEDFSAMLVSAGSDSKVQFWRDVTEEEELQQTQQREAVVLLEQQLTNLVRNRNYGQAFVVALQLGHSFKLLGIITAILEDEDELQQQLDLPAGGDEAVEKGVFSQMWLSRLDPYIPKLSSDQIEKLVGYMAEWNTNARHCFASTLLFGSLLRQVGVNKLLELKTVQQSLPAMLAYSERHHNRISRLHQSTYLLEYVRARMSLQPLASNDKEIEPVGVKRNVSVTVASGDSKSDDVPVLFKPKGKKARRQ
mmetsp:Transcript_11269/g.16966  ORF Transcript_11269/g.16966 Transcript_11269/m.16966 type:complete len:841 (-) Transcript_11269:67-2589(-)